MFSFFFSLSQERPAEDVIETVSVMAYGLSNLLTAVRGSMAADAKNQGKCFVFRKLLPFNLKRETAFVIMLCLF